MQAGWWSELISRAFLFGLPICAVLVVAIFSRIRNRRENIFLAVVLMGVLYHQFLSYLRLSLPSTGVLGRLGFPVSLLTAFCVFGYVRSLVEGSLRLRKSDVFALLIPLGGLIYALLARPETDTSDLFFRLPIVLVAFGVSLTRSYQLLRNFESIQGRNFFSDERVAALHWLRFLITTLAVLVFVGSIEAFSSLIYGIGGIICLGGTLISCGLAFYALRVSPILAKSSLQLQATRSHPISSDTELSDLKKKIGMVIEEKQPHLTQGLLLSDLAEELGMRPHELSQIINQGFGQTFFEFINCHRVEAAKKKLLDPALKHYTILAIAMDSGFSSKSTFNDIFKKATGVTPSEFRESGRPSS